MARPGIAIRVAGAIDEARKQGFEAIRQHVRVEDERTKTVTIRVVPFKVPTQVQHSFLIIFESDLPAEDGPSSDAPRTSLVVDPIPTEEQSSLGRQIVQLRQEWPPPGNTCSPSSSRRKAQTRNCSQPMKRFNRATKSCKVRTKSCRPRKRNWSRPTKNYIRSTRRCSIATSSSPS